jgi:hypothetical protein
MSDVTLDNPTLKSLAAQMRRLQERVEDMEDLIELRAAVERNAGKAGTSWEQVKAELNLDDRQQNKRPTQNPVGYGLKSTTQSGNSRSMPDGRIYIERRDQGDYAVRRSGAERASAVAPTQREAIEKAKELAPGVRPLVERVRDTAGGGRDKWRRA